MDSVQNNNVLSRKQARQASATASSIIQSSDENPDEVADNLNFAREFAATTGNLVPPLPMVKDNRDALQRLIDDVRNKEILSSSPRLARWLNENAATTPLAKDDLHNLSALERLGQTTPRSPVRQPAVPPVPLAAPFSRPPATQPRWPDKPFAESSTPPEMSAAQTQKTVDQNWFDNVDRLDALNNFLNGTTTPDPDKLALGAPLKDGAPPTPGSWADWLTGQGNSFLRGGYGVAQMYNQYMMEQTAARARDRKMSFNELLESQREPIVTRQGKIIPPLSPVEYFFAGTRWLDARYADLIETDDEASSQEYAQSLGKNIAAIKALPKSAMATAAENAMFVDGASFQETINNIGSAINENPTGVLAWVFETAGETVPQMAAVTAATAATRNPAIPFIVARGATYVTERYTSPADFFEKKGFDLTKPKDIERLLHNPAVVKEASERGFIRALTVTAFDAVSGGLAEKLGVGNRVGQLAADTVQAAIASGTGELAAQKLAGDDTDWNEVLKQSLSSIGTLPADAALSAFEARRESRDAAAAASVAPTPTAPPATAPATPTPAATPDRGSAPSTMSPAAQVPTSSAVPAPVTTAPADTVPAIAAPTPTSPEVAPQTAPVSAATTPESSAAPSPPAETLATTAPAAPAPTGTTPVAPATRTDNNLIQSISKASTNSLLRSRSGGEFYRLMTAMLKGTTTENLHVPVDVLAEQLKTHGSDLSKFAASTHGMSTHDVMVALTTGSAIKLSAAAYATDHAGGKFDAFLQENSSFNPRIRTAAEAKLPQAFEQSNAFNLRGERTTRYGRAIDDATKRLLGRDLDAQFRKIIADAEAAPGSGKNHQPSFPALPKTKRLNAPTNTKRNPPGKSINPPTDNQ